jgi:hypothetical protein
MNGSVSSWYVVNGSALKLIGSARFTIVNIHVVVVGPTSH